MPVRGILDLLDDIDQMLGGVKLVETIDYAVVRANQIKIQNARMAIQEVRRRIERVGQETRT